uniref:Corticotropin-releasing factor domain-containing protein n=1 Tax=Hippocampus comes TaxID=109280 RepID=A0A3Q2YNK0_HIPCM
MKIFCNCSFSFCFCCCCFSATTIFIEPITILHCHRRGSLLRNGGKEERRSQLTLSLDLPTNIMNVIFEMAKDQNLRSKADENARLLARIGRRK